MLATQLGGQPREPKARYDVEINLEEHLFLSTSEKVNLTVSVEGMKLGKGSQLNDRCCGV